MQFRAPCHLHEFENLDETRLLLLGCPVGLPVDGCSAAASTEMLNVSGTSPWSEAA